MSISKAQLEKMKVELEASFDARAISYTEYTKRLGNIELALTILATPKDG